MELLVLAIGGMVFLAHFLSLQFRRTHIPDVLILTVLGIVVGPLLGLVSPADFGKVGPLLATIALVVILFESGLSLDLRVLAASVRTSGGLAIACFIATVALVMAVAMVLFGLEILPALLLGLTLGGTSSAVVIPMVQALRMGERPSTVLVLESALTDVLCIVGVFAVLQAMLQGDVAAGKLAGNVLAALMLATALGVIGGLGWLLVLGKVRDFPNTISSTLAYVFIVYGAAEFLGFSGAIAALALGVTMTNYRSFGLDRFSWFAGNLVPLTQTDLDFYREAVFLLKTYFFVYLGISIHFGSWQPVAGAVLIVMLVYAARLLLSRLILQHAADYSLRDRALTSMMAPKGLAAAVLASLPMQFGVPGAEQIRDVAFMTVLVSIVLTALLVMLYTRPGVRDFYGRVLGAPGGQDEPITPGR